MLTPHLAFHEQASSALNATPEILVGIVTKNRAAILPAAINSALAQDFAGKQIVVLDDASDDETPRLKDEFSTVNWYRSPSSLGLMEARNKLMRMPARYFLSLDDDAWFLNGDEITLAVKHLDANPLVAAVAFDILGPSRPQPISRSEPRPVYTFVGCGHVLRLSAAQQVGLYTPSPEPYGAEERDLCLRLLDENLEVHLLPGVHVWHERTGAARDLRAQHSSGVCNDLAFLVQRCPLPLIPFIFPIKFINHLRFGIQRSFFLKPCLDGFRLFALHLPGIWARRAPVRTATFLKSLRLSRSA